MALWVLILMQQVAFSNTKVKCKSVNDTWGKLTNQETSSCTMNYDVHHSKERKSTCLAKCTKKIQNLKKWFRFHPLNMTTQECSKPSASRALWRRADRPVNCKFCAQAPAVFVILFPSSHLLSSPGNHISTSALVESQGILLLLCRGNAVISILLLLRLLRTLSRARGNVCKWAPFHLFFFFFPISPLPFSCLACITRGAALFATGVEVPQFFFVPPRILNVILKENQ